MKRKVFITGLLVFAIQAVSMQAQMVISIITNDEVEKTEPIDETAFSVQYQTSFIPDTLKPERTTNETMMLKVGGRSSVYYSYARFLSDSVIDDLKKKNVSIDLIADQIKQYHSMITYKVYKNYPLGKVTMLEQIAMNRYRCEEENERQSWKLLADTDTTILSYPCRKAVCRFRGREWIVWYTPEIPRSEGPWKLHGLPGLILKAADSRNHYTFECSGIVNGREGESIQFGATGYEPVSRKNLNKLYERNAADPVGFAKASAPNLNLNITIQDENGQQVKAPRNMPHNPIELE
ncbi:MAG: GLPGLI family protein [Tannerellaceae bacterium]|nr:GLPGLI family protein [Tannerellaceae bacterium]